MTFTQRVLVGFTLLALLASAADALAADKKSQPKKKTYLERVSLPPVVASQKSKPAARNPGKKLARNASSKAKQKKTRKTALARPATGKALRAGKPMSRDIVFDGSTVNGQYHSAGEAVAKVEQEKQMNDLIGMRRDFKDRLAAEKERLSGAGSDSDQNSNSALVN